MKNTLELNAGDIRIAILEYLRKRDYPDAVLESFGANDFSIRTTWRSNETWRRPTYVRFIVEKETP